MLIRNTNERFGLVSILLHWVVALLIIGLIVMGLYMTRIPISAWKLKLFRWHKEFGMLVLFLAFVRIAWRASNALPKLELPVWETIAARSAHYVFYFMMLALPITGLILSSAAGIPGVFFGLFVFPNWVSVNEQVRLLYTQYHAWLAYALIALIFAHVSAALMHHFVNKNQILKRMLWP